MLELYDTPLVRVLECQAPLQPHSRIDIFRATEHKNRKVESLLMRGLIQTLRECGAFSREHGHEDERLFPINNVLAFMAVEEEAAGRDLCRGFEQVGHLNKVGFKKGRDIIRAYQLNKLHWRRRIDTYYSNELQQGKRHSS